MIRYQKKMNDYEKEKVKQNERKMCKVKACILNNHEDTTILAAIRETTTRLVI